MKISTLMRKTEQGEGLIKILQTTVISTLKMVLIVSLIFLFHDKSFATTGDILSVKDYGAVGDGITDDTAAIQNAIAQANTLKKSVFIPGGNYLISSTLTLSSTTLIGEGALVEGGTARSVLTTKTTGLTMLTCGVLARVENLGIQGNNVANIGVKITGVRVGLINIEVYRCRKSSYVLVATQNSCFINCFSSYSATAFTLANGARNNNFYNCTSNNMVSYYNASAIGVPWSSTKLIYYVIDTTDPDYGSSVTLNGNDRNNWFGGIHERAPIALTFENKSGYTGFEGFNNQFYGVEFTCGTILDTSNSQTPGTLLMDSCAYILNDQVSPFSVGTSGFIRFQGEPYFSGANMVNNRGISQPSNYASLFLLNSDVSFQVASYNGGSITTDTSNKSVTINGGTSNVGARFIGMARGNISNTYTNQYAWKPAGLTANLTFTITTISGSNPVLVMLGLSASPWVRTIGTCATPGTYSIPVRIGENPLDTLGTIVFSANGNVSCTIKGVSLNVN